MIFKRLTSSTQGFGIRSLKWTTVFCCLTAFAPLAGSWATLPAVASDLDIEDTMAVENGSTLIRMAWNKSMVIRLPAEAQDVIVGNSSVVDAIVRTKNTAYLFARSVGQTNIFFFDASGKQILNIDLEVAIDALALQNMLKRTIPGTKIKADTLNNSVVLSGTAPNAAEASLAVEIAEKFITRISEGVRATDQPFESGVINTIKILGADQVMLKVRVVEVQRDVLKQFGVNLQALINVGSFAFNVQSITQLGQEIVPITLNSGYAAGFASGGTSVTGVLRALESDGLLKTLAEPNLTAVSGQPAMFHAGGEVPLRNCDTPAADPAAPAAASTFNCEIEYKPFGVTLGFTPVVLSEGRINLKINSEVSELGPPVDGSISFLTRKTDTVVELPSGGSMMLAGLIKDTTRQAIDGTPGLNKLPILGALFRSRDFISNQTELVVIVTPYLVGSVAERQLSSPVDNLNLPTDRQTILLGRLNKVYGTPGNHPDGVYHGNVGFIVE